MKLQEQIHVSIDRLLSVSGCKIILTTKVRFIKCKIQK